MKLPVERNTFAEIFKPGIQNVDLQSKVFSPPPGASMQSVFPDHGHHFAISSLQVPVCPSLSSNSSAGGASSARGDENTKKQDVIDRDARTLLN
jgi:hypothetical protein